MRQACVRLSLGCVPITHAGGHTRVSFGQRLIVIACGALSVVALAATRSSAQIGIGSDLRVDRPARSMKDLRDQGLVKQRFDFSCGAAALATILRYGFGENVTERQILVQLFDLMSDQEKKASRSTGFSLLHLQRVAQARGYNAEGFRLRPEQLPLLGGPVIVFIEPHGYKHFAVLRGVREDRIYLADPSRGNMRMPAYAFLRDWLQDAGAGIAFIVEPKSGLPHTDTLLALPREGPRRPEMMSVREMLAVGSPLVRLSRRPR